MNSPSERAMDSVKLPNLVQQFSVLNFLYIVISNFDEKSVTFGTTFKKLTILGISDAANVNY